MPRCPTVGGADGLSWFGRVFLTKRIRSHGYAVERTGARNGTETTVSDSCGNRGNGPGLPTIVRDHD